MIHPPEPTLFDHDSLLELGTGANVPISTTVSWEVPEFGPFYSFQPRSAVRRNNSLRKLIILLFLPCLVAANDTGKLVIAGGALSTDNEPVYREFIDAVGRSSRIAVISAASENPVESAESARQALENYGVVKQRVIMIRLAVEDDQSTALVDEREWSDNASDPEEIAKLTKVGGIWFTDGDQRRLTEALLIDGQPTAMLRAISSRHKSGAVIGGTSAGAAIMSNPMITQGETLATLLRDPGYGELLELAPGLGFFRGGLVDQQFDAQARLGRLALALRSLPGNARLGFGIDENTALVSDGNVLEVFGKGQVTMLDGRSASWEEGDDGYSITGLKLSIFSPGDRYDVARKALNPASYLRLTWGKEYFQMEPQSGGGIALPSGPLSKMLGQNLVDNLVAERFSAISFALGDSQTGRGVRYVFSQEEETRAYRGRDANGEPRYSMMNVGFDIEPIRISID